MGEWCSGPGVSLFGAELASLGLPIEDAPEVPWGDLKDWVSPAQFGGLPGDGKDDTEAIQQAIDSGAGTVYLTTKKELPARERGGRPGWEGAYEISDTIHIRGAVRRIIGLVGNRWQIGPGAKLWARQLNLEGDGMKLVNDGGQVWILGLKTEAAAPSVETLNGGRTEILIRVVLDPVLEDDAGSTRITGGDEIAVFTVEGTGGWDTYRTFTLPVKIAEPGKHEVALLIERADSKFANALVNIDWFECGYAPLETVEGKTNP